MISSNMLATGICLLGSTAFASPPTDGMFRGNAAHSGVYTSPGVPRLHGVKWRFKTGAGVISSPAVVAGTVYVGSNDHHLYAIDAVTGKERWKFRTGGQVRSSPAISNGQVYVVSYDGFLYAINAATGTLAWKFSSEGEQRFAARHIHGIEPAAQTMPDPFDFYLSSPMVEKGKIFFGSGDGAVYAVQESDGKLAWKFQTGNVVHASPALADGTLYVGSWDTYFYALDARTGTLRWRFKTGDDPKVANQTGIQASAVVSDGVVYFGCRDANLYALDARTGEKLWAFSTKPAWVITSPALRDGRVYLATGDTGLLHALDARTGEAIFSIGYKWPMFSSPALAGDRLYIGSHEGKLHVVDTSRRAHAWTFQTQGSRENGTAYTTEKGGPNYAAAFSDIFYDDVIVGVRRLMGVGAILSSPAVEGDSVYFGSMDGHVYALR